MQRTRLAGTVAGLTVASMLAAGCAGPSPTPSVGPSPAAQPVLRELVDPNDILAGAARYGDLVFTAGFLGDAAGDDFDADVNNALDQLEAALGKSGAGFDTLLKVNVYLTDWNNWEAYNRIYQDRIAEFGSPPRTTVEVSRLGLDAPIEIAAVAHVRPATP
jgi:2-iminobutanoate/2-iminopropanoate deaminase